MTQRAGDMWDIWLPSSLAYGDEGRGVMIGVCACVCVCVLMLASRGDRPWRFSALYAAAYENKINCPVSYNQQFEIEQTMSSLSFEADSKFIGGLVRAGTRIARQAPPAASSPSSMAPSSLAFRALPVKRARSWSRRLLRRRSSSSSRCWHRVVLTSKVNCTGSVL